jgi:hypothetical protein
MEKLKEVFMYALGALIVLGFFGTIGVLMFVELSPSVHDALMLLLGVEATAFGAVVNYFYGSSKGSADKTAMLKNGNGAVD